MFKKSKSKVKNIRNKAILLALVILYLVNAMLLLQRPLLEGTSYESPIYMLSDSEIVFLSDITHNGSMDHTIFQTLFTAMNESEDFLITDMFLLSTSHPENQTLGNVTGRFFDHLNNGPNQTILITDPLNTFYGSYEMPLIEDAKNANISVFFTDHSVLRPSNIVWSALYYPTLSWIPKRGAGSIPHPFGDEEQKVTVRSFLALLNFQANHRKVAVMDNQDSYLSFVLSANPHNPSSYHSNIGFMIKGDFAQEILFTESVLADFEMPEIKQTTISSGDIALQLLTEKAILNSIIADIKNTSAGDHIDIAMFYMSERSIIRELKDAARRDVTISIILDPNKDAFGREKSGIPNRQVAFELQRSHENIEVRWYDTQGEQFHSKMLVITKADFVIIHGGSSNFTRRNLGGFNLETNIRILAPIESRIAKDVLAYFETISEFTLEYEAYKDHNILRYVLYRFQEWSGLSTF